MLISSLNSKKCLIVSLFSFGAATLSAAAVTSPPSSHALQKEIHSFPKGSLSNILSHWEKNYGTAVVPELLRFSSDSRFEDTDRYVALMGAAKLGGYPIAPKLSAHLKDASWMIRCGALRVLSALEQKPESAQAVLPLLRDRALVVRLEAVEAVKKLQPPGSVAALLQAIKDPLNYRGGKAQWIPQKALEALVLLKAHGVSAQLSPLLDHHQDPRLQESALNSIEALENKKLKPGQSLFARIQAWKMQLQSRK